MTQFLQHRITLTGLLILACLLAFFISWPLPRYADEGIPQAAQTPEDPPARFNIAGDHLQLMYHFDLVHDMITGRVTWFHNPFEFNVDGDETTYRPGAYFLPLSSVYALLCMITERPLAYNLTWLFSIWLTALFGWAWLSRFTTDKIAVFVGVLILLLVPFRWFSIFSGSPAGMALCWVPFLAWRVDAALRSPGWGSGAWVGLALLLCFWGDLHVFYFSTLALPAFAALSVLSQLAQGRPLPWRHWYRIIPLGLVSFGGLAVYHFWRRHLLDGSMMRGGRSWLEVSAFSPLRIGLLGQGRALDDTLFIGLVTTLVLLVLSLAVVYQTVRHHNEPSSRYRFLAALLLWAATLATIALALGVHGPFSGLLLDQARAHIPYFDMVRQPWKIYALMPVWLGGLGTIGWSVLPLSMRFRPPLAALLACGMTYEIHAHFGVTTSLLKPEQAAYERVLLDAQTKGHHPAHALVIPLWPGESSNTSVPIFHAHHYGIRLVNGYSPVISRDYFENVFRRLESINQGWLPDDRIDFLLQRNIRYVLLHENQFPEKVSPYPVALTRDRLLANPRVDLLHQADGVLAFRLRAEADPEPRTRRHVVRFPTRRWTFAGRGSPQQRQADASTHTGQYLHMIRETPPAQSPVWRIAPDADQYWWIRMRGDATIRLKTHWNGETWDVHTEAVKHPDWHWMRWPLPDLPDFGAVQLSIEVLEGALDADYGLLMMGHWPGLDTTTEEWTLYAADFFRAGVSKPDSHTVRMRPDYEVRGNILYGPRLPLAKGRYRIHVHTRSDAPAGTLLGTWQVKGYGGADPVYHEARAGHPTAIHWHQTGEYVVELRFLFNRVAEIVLEEIVFERLTAPESDQL